MINGRRICVVLPAYNAEKTLEQTFKEIPIDVVDIVLMVDDHSIDNTVAMAKRLGIETIVHDHNYGYGRNQKTCYHEAIKRGADVVVMVHPDYQYTPRLIAAMASMIAFDVYDVVLGSRIIGGRALQGGMPAYKYVSNRLLTALENLMLGSKLSEFHTGFRAYSKKVLESLSLDNNSDGFIFDNEIIVQVLFFQYRVGEISCPTRYQKESSSIDFKESMKYGFGVILTAFRLVLHRLKIIRDPLFELPKRRETP